MLCQPGLHFTCGVPICSGRSICQADYLAGPCALSPAYGLAEGAELHLVFSLSGFWTPDKTDF